MPGRLTVCPTPIGNMDDVSKRVREALVMADFVACEDTRRTGRLLERLEIRPKPRLVSNHEGNEASRAVELVKRMEGKPFALIGVDGDDDRDMAAKTMAKESMTWPSIWNGGQHGGVVAKFGVRSWPTLYLIDAQGVIRYRNIVRETLDKAVDKLVAEAEAAKK